ncbi:MAG: hypothetical protein ACRECT_05710 [Thermoplasmata archaeon]
MRALTDSEARVIAVLLAARPDRERERLHQVAIPRSTYHAVRRRAYEEGWLRDRYLPHPVVLGRPFATFLVARPYADRAADFARTVSGDGGNVVLWSASHLALAVFLHRTSTDGTRVVERLEKDRSTAPPLRITVSMDGPTVPVYFDFEGLWCHLAGLDGTLAYPHGLGGALVERSVDAPTEIPPLSAHQTWAMGELLRRPFSAIEQGRGGHLVGPFGLPFSQRRMLTKGWVTHRTLLEPARLAPYQGRAADQVVLISGTPKEGARPEQLFATLTRDCRVFPFLFVVGAERWLLGALGSSGAQSAADPERQPVLPTLRGALEGIEVLQEPAADFTSPVDHRYVTLLPPAGGNGAGKP